MSAPEGTAGAGEPSAAPVRCAICGTLVRGAEQVTSCPECRQDYHEACWSAIGGCATYGCKSAAVAEKPPPPEDVGGGWGDEKTCPSCGRTIGSSLLVCPCGARFPWPDPMTKSEFSAWTARERSIGPEWNHPRAFPALVYVLRRSVTANRR